LSSAVELKMNCESQPVLVWPVLGKVTFKSNALQYCVTP